MIETMETVHIYFEREEPPKENRTPERIMLLLSSIVFAGTIIFCALQPQTPLYRHETIRVPAIFLPLKTFTTSVVIIPTGKRYYPATQASGYLTVYNGSILSQELPKGMIFIGQDSVEVVSDETVFVPVGNPPLYGIANIHVH